MPSTGSGEDSRWACRWSLPDDLAGLPVARGEGAVEEGAVDQAAVVGGAGDDRLVALVLRVEREFADHLAIAELDRFAVAVLVDRVGDAAADRGRELDQRVGVDRPGLLQRRVERAVDDASVGGQVVGALGDATEEGPVDVAGFERLRGDLFGGACAGSSIRRRRSRPWWTSRSTTSRRSRTSRRRSRRRAGRRARRARAAPATARSRTCCSRRLYRPSAVRMRGIMMSMIYAL